MESDRNKDRSNHRIIHSAPKPGIISQEQARKAVIHVKSKRHL